MRQKHKRILLATAWRTIEYALGIIQYARQAGWHLDLTYHITGEIPLGWKGEGIITLLGEHKELTRFIKTKMSDTQIVCMSVNSHGLEIPCVDFDNEEIGKMAALHFIERYFKNYAFYSHVDWPVSTLRCDSYSRYIEETGCSNQIMIWNSEMGRQKNTWNNRQKWLKHKLARLSKPLAIFAVDDVHAVEIIEASMDRGYTVPDDVAILGVGNSKLLSSSSIINISSIRVDMCRLGYEAAFLLDDLMQSSKKTRESILIKPIDINIQQSTDVIATDNPDLKQVIRFMLNNFHRPIAIDDIVESSCTSQTTLYKLFKDDFNQSPARFLTSIRLEKAKKLLRESDFKITAIVNKCGFGNKVNFHRTFQRLEGITPNQYRKKISP